MVTGYVSVFDNGKQIDTLYPAKWFFRKHEQEPTTEVAIRRTLAEDLYIVLPAYDLGKQTASLQIVVNPLVDWIWFGFGILALGTGIALLPERAYSFALARVPEAATAASTTGVLLLCILLLAPAPVAAQMSGTMEMQTSYYPRSEKERKLQHEIVCTCGSCGHASIAECRKDPCAVSHRMRGELATLIDQGKSHDEIINWFVSHYGSEEMLGAPIDKGFNRLAWLLPFAAGAGGIVVVGFAAVKWSRKHQDDEPQPSAATDDDVDERLDDELRNLD